MSSWQRRRDADGASHQAHEVTRPDPIDLLIARVRRENALDAGNRIIGNLVAVRSTTPLEEPGWHRVARRVLHTVGSGDFSLPIASAAFAVVRAAWHYGVVVGWDHIESELRHDFHPYAVGRWIQCAARTPIDPDRLRADVIEVKRAAAVRALLVRLEAASLELFIGQHPADVARRLREDLAS